MPEPTEAPEAARAARDRRRRERTRAAILDAAEEVFRREGFRGARVEAVAAAADVSVGSIYVHFSGKSGVRVALVERSLELFAASMAATDAPELGPLQRVLAGGDAYLRFHLEHPGLFDLLATGAVADAEERDAALAGRVGERIGELLAAFAARIDDAVAAGEARAVDAERLTRFLWGAWNGVIALRHQLPGLAPDEEELAATLEVGRWMLREALAAHALRDERGEVGERVPMPFVARGAGP